MSPLMSEEEMDAMDSGEESDHELISTEMVEDIRVEVSLVLTLIKEKPFIKYVILIIQDNRNGKEL